MSPDAYEGWDSPPRSRGRESSPRSHRRRASGQEDGGWQPDGRDNAADEYGQNGYADQGDYGSRGYAEPDGYGAGGYGGDYRGGGPAYGSDHQGGYGQDQYSDDRHAGQGYGGSGYSNGYADDAYGGGYGGDGYGARDPYASGDPYATGDHGPADPYARPDPRASGQHGMTDPRASGPHGMTDPRASGPYGTTDPRATGPRGLTDPRASADPYRRGRDPYDTGSGGYPGPDSYADAAGYSDGRGYPAQDGYAGQDHFAGHDPYNDPAGAGHDRGGYEEQDDELYRWRDPQDAVGDPGLTRSKRGASREGEFDAEDPRHDGFFRGFGGGDDDPGGRGRGRGKTRGRPPRERKSHAGLVALAVVIAIFAGVAYTGYHYYSEYKARHASYSGTGYGHVLILVTSGDTLDGISTQLLHKGVIEAIDPWASYVANKGGLHPGTYRIHLHMSPAAAYAALINQKNLINSKVTIPDGMREVDILPLLAKESGIPLSQFQTAIKDTAALGLPAYANGNVEGYLYPDTYDIAPGETALKILQTAVAQFNIEATSLHLVAAAARVGYTPAQIITGASLLEAEVGSRYFGQVARVIDNRINQGMALQFDSTIAYILNKHTDQLTASDKQANSQYNTFTHKDLPPGPIDSPDAAAIQAFLAPPHGDWLYFITVDKSGTTDFTSSYTQFQTWQALAQRNGV
jgi:peptidoglycan lytic transglycosylase G